MLFLEIKYKVFKTIIFKTNYIHNLSFEIILAFFKCCLYIIYYNYN